MERKFVPTALHTELTEYTNLVRALRTTRTLDLTAHLLEHAAQYKGKEREKDSDTWTRWPLIDCPVPEWSLEDEIRQLGETVVQHHATRTRNGTVDRTHIEDDSSDADSDVDHDELSTAAAKHLVLHTGAILVHVLNLMADQRPSAPGSMQNRLCAMNWEDVISLLAVGGVVDSTVLARAEKRLERIYGPSSTKAIERLQSVVSTKARFSAMASIQEDQLLAPPAYSRTHRGHAKGGTLHQNGYKSRAIIDTDTDVDI